MRARPHDGNGGAALIANSAPGRAGRTNQTPPARTAWQHRRCTQGEQRCCSVWGGRVRPRASPGAQEGQGAGKVPQFWKFGLFLRFIMGCSEATLALGWESSVQALQECCELLAPACTAVCVCALCVHCVCVSIVCALCVCFLCVHSARCAVATRSNDCHVEQRALAGLAGSRQSFLLTIGLSCKAFIVPVCGHLLPGKLQSCWLGRFVQCACS